MNFDVWLGEWLTTCVRPMVKTRTYEKYAEIVRLKISPQLGGFELCDLTASVLQKFTATLTKTYSANTVTGVISVLRTSLVRAEQTGVVERQFSHKIQRPKSKEKRIECFSSGEQKLIENYVLDCGKDKFLGIILDLYTGLRIGELLALRWEDINFTKGVVNVTSSCYDAWDNNGYVRAYCAPKTETSVRSIPVPANVLRILRKAKRRSKSIYVVSNENGGDICMRSYQRSFELMLKKLGLGHRGFHALRHTFATRALECGMDVRTLAEILGHRNPNVTLKRYAHSMTEHKIAMMNRVGKLFEFDSRPKR